jgi:hypothetical protein
MRFLKNPGIQLLTRKPRNILQFDLVVGQVQENLDATTRQVKVLRMELNDYLKMYFNKSYLFETIDMEHGSKKGDIVLVRRLKNPPSQTKLYGIEKILFKIDEIIDPITGKKANENSEILAKFLEELSKKNSNNKATSS